MRLFQNFYTRMRRWSRGVDWQEAGGIALLLVLIILLWHTWLVYPLRVLVVFFYELSHGMAAYLTGGKVVAIEVERFEAGRCVTRGGWRFVVASAGYLGSLLWGVVLLRLSGRHTRHAAAVGALAVILIFATLIFVRPVLSFGFAFGLCTAGLLLLAALRLPAWANAGILKITGLTSGLYALLDIKSDILDRPGLHSDARILAEMTGVPALVWGLFWIGVALPIAAWALLRATRKAP